MAFVYKKCKNTKELPLIPYGYGCHLIKNTKIIPAPITDHPSHITHNS